MDEKNGLYILVVVGVVGILGIIMMYNTNQNSYGAAVANDNLIGQAAKVVKCVGAYNQECSVGIGGCLRYGTQTRTCLKGNVWSAWSVCSAVAGSPQPEVCDGVDNNCNGLIDENGVCNSNTCSDTDGGFVVSVPGTVNGLYNGQQYSNSDYCVNSVILIENYCSGTTPASMNFSCSGNFTQCSGGSCI
jgi:hypothetical protein